MASLKVISNSSPLINLSKVNRLHLLHQLYGEIIIPSAVYNEIVIEGYGRIGSEHIKKLCEEKKILVKKIANENLSLALKKDLDKGEAEVITLALETNHDLVLMDETEARRIASLYNLRFTGFIGILLKAFTKGLITDFKADLDQAIDQGFRINPRLYQELINRTQ